MEVDMERAVENIISKLEDDLGQDNLYKLIYAGKLPKEENPLGDYNIINKIPIIVMVTKLKDTAGMIDAVKMVLFDVIIHLPVIYFPTYYTVKEFVSGSSWNPANWVSNYRYDNTGGN